MGIIDDELKEVSKLCEHVIQGSRLISCVQSMVRVEIRRTSYKQIIACIQFPEKYPAFPLLIQLKSKNLSEKLLDRFTSICEEEAKKFLGKPQVIPVLKLVKTFIDENPLSCCYDEVSSIKRSLSAADELKLKQKTSSIILKLLEGKYFLKTRIVVPEHYPEAALVFEDVQSNFPPVLHKYMEAQAKEIVRQCVEPPLRKQTKAPPFSPSPSLQKAVTFLISTVHQLPGEKCQICHEQCLPLEPQDVEVDETADKHVERIYCGHLLHLQCLVSYMKTPPFQGGKKCPSCKQRIYHDKWRLSEKLAEDRWAHQQARERELQEVAEFLE